MRLEKRAVITSKYVRDLHDRRTNKSEAEDLLWTSWAVGGLSEVRVVERVHKGGQYIGSAFSKSPTSVFTGHICKRFAPRIYRSNTENAEREVKKELGLEKWC